MLGYVCKAKQGLHLQHLHINTHTHTTHNSPIHSDEGANSRNVIFETLHGG